MTIVIYLMLLKYIIKVDEIKRVRDMCKVTNYNLCKRGGGSIIAPL